MSKHGGKREGAGRKPKPESQKLQPVTVWLTQEQIDFCKRFGSVSSHARLLIASEIANSQMEEDYQRRYRKLRKMLYEYAQSIIE